MLRLFLIYGFFSKREIAVRNGIKEITYDKYKLTIHNLIDNGKFRSYTNDNREKVIYIHADYTRQAGNPLYSIWEGKSITANDLWYLFAITDVLAREGRVLSAGEITDRLAAYDGRSIEAQTVRNRLSELDELGVVQAERAGKMVHYRLEDPWLEKLRQEELNRLYALTAFFQHVIPVGVPGYHLNRRLSRLTGNFTPEPFLFKHLHPAHAMDDESLLAILQAIGERWSVRFDLQMMDNEVVRFKSIPFVPMKLIDDVWQGRRYIAGYDLEMSRYWCFRLDKMYRVEPTERYDSFEEGLKALTALLAGSWNVVMPADGKEPDRLVMQLRIDSAREFYVLDRLKSEGKQGTVRQIERDLFEYSIEVHDATEMLPWVRTFTGRIAGIQCSNPAVAHQLTEDWRKALAFYDSGESG